MLTHDQKTKIKLAMARRKHPDEIAAEMGVDLADVLRCLEAIRPRAAVIFFPDRSLAPHRRVWRAR